MQPRKGHSPDPAEADEQSADEKNQNLGLLHQGNCRSPASEASLRPRQYKDRRGGGRVMALGWIQRAIGWWDKVFAQSRTAGSKIPTGRDPTRLGSFRAMGACGVSLPAKSLVPNDFSGFAPWVRAFGFAGFAPRYRVGCAEPVRDGVSGPHRFRLHWNRRGCARCFPAYGNLRQTSSGRRTW